VILLDTNVVSEPLKLTGNQNVLGWLDAQNIETLYLSTITLAELRFGIAVLPQGKRKDTLHTRLEEGVLPLFVGRILPFDTEASKAYAILCARARAAGQTIAPADGYIAAIAASKEFAVATRDVSPFESAALVVINPWNWGVH
jgi:predicted nucleic acid-binding protein